MINLKFRKYIALYFEKTSKIMKDKNNKDIITMQFFQRSNDVVLCGINEVLSLLKESTEYKKYSIKYLPEGSVIKEKEVVLELEGKYQYFGALEGIIDGILSRMSSIATNSRNVIKAAGQKEVIFLGDRSDHYINQSRDGYAVDLGGIKTQVTKEQVSLTKGKITGTMPHALIQMHKGDVIEAVKAFRNSFPNDDIAVLVDFNNNVINDSLKILKEFGEYIKAVRVDTAPNLVDISLEGKEEYGVTSNLIKLLRKELDQKGGKHIKIIVSSGFTSKKIKQFENENTPVDYYGVGSSILKINLSFTADAVRLNKINIAKVGRKYNHSDRLIKLK
ncbi:MAG: nicotinate phosphoribosyltransferase [Mycoplasma sp.]|nr:nicotinate phosphoribosyltransferase [Mycoplasma sp.]